MKLARTLEQWRNCAPEAMAAMSPAAIMYALEDAKHDILALASAVEGAAVIADAAGAEIRALRADNASMLDSLQKESAARCELEDRLAGAVSPQVGAFSDEQIERIRHAVRTVLNGAEIQSLWTDAHRYRWLRERAWYVEAATYFFFGRRERRGHDASPCDPDEVETAIDAAREETGHA